VAFGQRQDRELWNNQISRPSLLATRFIKLLMCKLPEPKRISNLVPRAHVSFGQCQDTELCNNQISRPSLLASRFIKLLIRKLPERKRISGCSFSSAEINCFRQNQVTAGNTSAFAGNAEVKLLLNKSEEVTAGEREFQTNMVQKTPTKPVNTKICRCCCKPLGPNDHPISLFRRKVPKGRDHGRIQ